MLIHWLLWDVEDVWETLLLTHMFNDCTAARKLHAAVAGTMATTEISFCQISDALDSWDVAKPLLGNLPVREIKLCFFVGSHSSIGQFPALDPIECMKFAFHHHFTRSHPICSASLTAADHFILAATLATLESYRSTLVEPRLATQRSSANFVAPSGDYFVHCGIFRIAIDLLISLVRLVDSVKGNFSQTSWLYSVFNFSHVLVPNLSTSSFERDMI